MNQNEEAIEIRNVLIKIGQICWRLNLVHQTASVGQYLTPQIRAAVLWLEPKFSRLSCIDDIKCCRGPGQEKRYNEIDKNKTNSLRSIISIQTPSFRQLVASIPASIDRLNLRVASVLFVAGHRAVGACHKAFGMVDTSAIVSVKCSKSRWCTLQRSVNKMRPFWESINNC